VVQIIDILNQGSNQPFIVCDFSPPRGPVYDDAFDPIDLTPDAFSVAYSPGRSVRVNPVVTAHWLQVKTQIPAIFTLATRDMNQLALEGLILGAQVLGLDNMVSVAGDPFSRQESKKLTVCRNITSTEFIKYAKLMNQRLDFRSRWLNYPTNLCVGATVDLNKNWNSEIDLTQSKISAGSDFFLAQPVFDACAPLKFLENYEDRMGQKITIPVMWGIQMMTRNSTSLVSIPESMKYNLRRGADPVDVAVSMIEEYRKNGFQYFYLIPPILEGGKRDYELAQAVIEMVKL